MTTASQIITDAYRESNLIAISASPSTAEQSEALRRLNSLILSTIGNEAGTELTDLDIGGENDLSSYASNGAPDDCRLVCILSAATEIELDPLPYEGQRVAWVDAGANFATYNLTINPNGRQIGGSTASLVLSANGDNRQYMYRGDTANWVRLTDLATSDQMPFPSEFDDYFITRLAMRLNPRHGAALTKETLAALDRSESQIRARYRKPRPQQDWGSLGLMGQSIGGGDSTAFYRG